MQLNQSLLTKEYLSKVKDFFEGFEIIKSSSIEETIIQKIFLRE